MYFFQAIDIFGSLREKNDFAEVSKNLARYRSKNKSNTFVEPLK